MLYFYPILFRSNLDCPKSTFNPVDYLPSTIPTVTNYGLYWTNIIIRTVMNSSFVSLHHLFKVGTNLTSLWVTRRSEVVVRELGGSMAAVWSKYYDGCTALMVKNNVHVICFLKLFFQVFVYCSSWWMFQTAFKLRQLLCCFWKF